ncbi:MAG TPA: VOC family protein [Burkholderiales bacterium]|nr:VOC family protein [Burkholderiales bacterium]
MSIADQQKPPPGELYLDHVSHFVADLDAAAQLLEALGFRVTPLSVQQVGGAPVGASNRCVMLEEGYIEILAPTLDTPHAQRMRAEMARYAGVHLACFGAPDAKAEHRRLAAHGFSPQPLVDLAREVEGGNTVRFKVARPAPEAMPEGRVQIVQQMTPEHIWLPGHLAHTNGVKSLRALYVVAQDVPDAVARWARFSALFPNGNILESDRGRVIFLTQEGLSGLLGDAPSPPALAGYALGCQDAAGFANRCSAAGLAVRKTAHGYAVSLPPSLGGTWVLT